MHDFNKSLALSHSASDLPFWGECYNSAFPTMQAMHDHRQDGDHQRQGIDRSIVLRNGKTLWVDEKVRFKDYGDILLEEWSDLERKSPGWVIKPLLADYIAYAIAPTGKCYLLPVPQLQTAWLTNCELWKATRRPKDVPNRSWTTRNWPVTEKELFPALGQCLRVRFTPYNPEPKRSAFQDVLSI